MQFAMLLPWTNQLFGLAGHLSESVHLVPPVGHEAGETNVKSAIRSNKRLKLCPGFLFSMHLFYLFRLWLFCQLFDLIRFGSKIMNPLKQNQQMNLRIQHVPRGLFASVVYGHYHHEQSPWDTLYVRGNKARL